MLYIPTHSFAQGQLINNFIVKENLTKNGKMAIIAVDSLENANESINGTFLFALNGFQQSLQFHNGVAVPAHTTDGSTFVFFKHNNQHQSVGKLYFIYKKNSGISPYKINGLLLLVIPALLLLLGYIFKKLLITFVILGFVYGYLSFNKGLEFTQILESAFQIIKNIT